MEELCKDLKLVFDDETVIGKAKDIIEMMYRLIKYEIDNVEDLEEKLSSINEKMDFINEITTDIESGIMNYIDIIKIYSNPMGGFNYEGV